MSRVDFIFLLASAFDDCMKHELFGFQAGHRVSFSRLPTAKETCYHRIGGVGNELVAQINSQKSDHSAKGILTLIENQSQIYDELASVWSPDYLAKRDSLWYWIKNAREYLTHTDIRSKKC
jgi:hypothetical protein